MPTTTEQEKQFFYTLEDKIPREDEADDRTATSTTTTTATIVFKPDPHGYSGMSVNDGVFSYGTDFLRRYEKSMSMMANGIRLELKMRESLATRIVYQKLKKYCTPTAKKNRYVTESQEY